MASGETKGIRTNTKSLITLSRTISHALRHEPWVYELELDEEGWTDAQILLNTLQAMRPEWKDINVDDLITLNNSAGKKRFEIDKGRIRALYGHSLPGKMLKTPSEPPEYLYHGTNPAIIPKIKENGLQPMNRQYVHLSTDKKTAIEVGKRKANNPILITISSSKAHREGIIFYIGNDKVWLADQIPPKYLSYE